VEPLETMKKLLIPSHQNREACLQQLWSKLYVEESIEDRIRLQSSWIEADLADDATAKTSPGGVGKTSLSASNLSACFFDRACIDRRQGNTAASDPYLRQSFTYAYLARELNVLARQATHWPELKSDDLLMTLVAWQGLSAACGSPWFALWVAPHLHNQFGNPDPEQGLLHYYRDKPAQRFMSLLQRSLITATWPTHLDLPALSGYGPLLQACSQPELWQAALVDYCDWRLANAYGYAFMGAPKRRRQSNMESVLDREAVEQVFPVELLTLRLAYERATGQPLSLDAPHPMLQGPLMALPFPSVEPLFEDEWTRRLEALRAEASAGRLAARAPVKARYL
jgi:hypothetical protein